MDLQTSIYVINDFIYTCNKFERKPVVALTGGDPLLHPHFWDIMQLLNQHKVEIHILGNPFHLNEKVLSNLKNNGCTAYQMSLDGMQETHDTIRKLGSFSETLEKIKLINESGISSCIMSTVSKLNISEIPELVDIVVSHKVSSFSFARYCPSEGDFDSIVSAKEYHDFLEKMWEKFREYKDSDTKFVLKDHLWTLFLYEKGLYPISNQETYICDGCHCGISHMTVLANGDVYACRRSHTPVGHLPEESLYDIFLSPQMDEYRKFDKFIKCKECELLRYCRGCPSVANCLYGDFYQADPQCWKQIH